MICCSCERNETGSEKKMMCAACEAICDHCGGTAYPIKGSEPATPQGWIFVTRHKCYHPDPKQPGMGIYSCPYCGRGKPDYSCETVCLICKNKIIDQRVTVPITNEDYDNYESDEIKLNLVGLVHIKCLDLRYDSFKNIIEQDGFVRLDKQLCNKKQVL